MRLENPINFLLNEYYNLKYRVVHKKYQHKTLNFFISSTYRKTAMNKKFHKLRPVFNPFLTLYFKRTIYDLDIHEIIKIMDLIDAGEIVNNPRYDFLEYHIKEPISTTQYYSLKNYNFYDYLMLEYAEHKDRDRTFADWKKHETDKFSLSFN